MRIILTLSVFIVALSSCKKSEPELGTAVEDHFFLENNEAVMPILVKGNTASKVLIVTLHGGPGDSGISDFGYSGVFAELEKDYGLVYYDQRCAGTSQGNCNTTQLEVSDFVEDLDKLLILLEHRYGNDQSMFALGHSWGAQLLLDHAVNGTQTAKVKGYIQSNGSHNIPKLFFEEKANLIHFATQQIALGNQTSEWQTVLDAVSNTDPTDFEDQKTLLSHSTSSEALLQAVDSIAGTFSSSFSFGNFVGNQLVIFANSTATNNQFLFDLFSYDISDKLNLIDRPIAFYWGKFDLIHPPTMAVDMFNLCGSANKEILFFNRSGHSPMSNENGLYQSKVAEFVEIWR